MAETPIQFRIAFSGTGTGSAASSNPIGLAGASPGPTAYVGLPFDTPGPFTVDFTAIADPGSVFVGWTAVNDNLFPPAIIPSPSTDNPVTFTHDNVDETYTITAQFDLAPCYDLTPCSPDKDELPIIVTNDLAIYVGQVIQILGKCYTVSLAISCDGAVTLNNPVITGPFPDCCNCDPDPVYELIDCSLQNPSIFTTNDMSQYVGQTIKVCEFVSSPVIGIAGVPRACLFPTHIGFVTQITGPNSGDFYDPNTGLIDSYQNPLNFPIELGDQLCVNDILIAPALPLHNALQYTGGTYIIQFFIGATAITNQITVNPGMSIADLQWFIDQQITYPNTTIVVNTFDAFNNLNVTVTISESIVETELNVIVTPPTSVPPAYPPTSTVTEDITGDCICYDVILSGEICDILPAFTGVVSGVFDDCECCDPPPSPEPTPYIPAPPEIDKHTYKVTESQCDIDANKTFANAMYDIYKTDAYGLESCCPRNFDQIWIQKELSDLTKINC